MGNEVPCCRGAAHHADDAELEAELAAGHDKTRPDEIPAPNEALPPLTWWREALQCLDDADEGVWHHVDLARADIAPLMDLAHISRPGDVDSEGLVIALTHMHACPPPLYTCMPARWGSHPTSRMGPKCSAPAWLLRAHMSLGALSLPFCQACAE